MLVLGTMDLVEEMRGSFVVFGNGLTVSAIDTVSPHSWRRRATAAAALARRLGRIVDIVVLGSVEVKILGK